MGRASARSDEDCYRASMQVFLRLAVAAALIALSAAAPAVQADASAPPQQLALRQAGTVDVGGLWCGAGLLHEFTLEIVQQMQNVHGRLTRKTRVREITGRVEGALVRTDPQRDHTMELLAEGNELRIVGATGMLALAKGQSFRRAAGGSCRP
jgi:hypothetical protein